MKKTITRIFVLAAALWGTAWQSAKALDRVDGVYQIRTEQDLTDFGALIAAGNDVVNAELLADITYSGDPLGGAKPFHGIFDGKGHTITLNMTRNVNGAALFWSAEKSALVKNLTVDGTITTSAKNAAAFANYGSGMFANCVAKVNIVASKDNLTNTDGSHGGFIAQGYNTTRIINCVSASSITTSDGQVQNCAGFIGWTSSGQAKLINCLCIADVQTTGTSATFARNNSKLDIDRCYYVTKVNNTVKAGAVQVTEEALTDGTLLALLNNAIGHAWVQGEQYPVPSIEEDWVEIGSVDELKAFAALVNVGNSLLNAKLTADLDMAGITDWTPIGNDTFYYRASFDGQNHKISNLALTNAQGATLCGLFGTASSGASFSNFWLDETCSIVSTAKYTGLVAHSNDPGYVRFYNVGNAGNVTSTGTEKDSGTAALLGNANASSRALFDACWTSGAIKSANDVACISGWEGNGLGSLTNCWSVSELASLEVSKFLNSDHYLARYAGDAITTNCYGLAGTQAPLITLDEVASGSLCYKLNEGNTTQPTFFQKIGTDPRPTLTGSDIVYNSTVYECDGLTVRGGGFTNTEGGSTIEDHQFENGVCTVCAVNEADANQYTLSTASHVRHFAGLVNSGKDALCATLANDIDLTDEANIVIGRSKYTGTFDGQGYTLQNYVLTTDAANQGLFGTVNGGTVKNLTATGSITVAGNHNNVGLVGSAKENAKLENVHANVNVSIEAKSDHAGGLLGELATATVERCSYNGAFTFNDKASSTKAALVGYTSGGSIKDCAVYGTIEGTASGNMGGILGYVNSDKLQAIQNCLVAATFDTPKATYGAIVANINKNTTKAVVTNNYFLTADELLAVKTNVPNLAIDATAVTADQLASGEVAYKLNGDQNQITWYQTLGEDAAPVLDATHKPVLLTDGTYANPTPVAIDALTADAQPSAIYNMAGQRVNKAQKGLYIVAGKKVVIK